MQTDIMKQLILSTTPVMVHVVQLRHGLLLLFADQYGKDSSICSKASLEQIRVGIT